jgi:anti-sigma regulatory factor (Ser/Thr protein kinase)
VSAWVKAWAREHALPATLVQHLDLCAAELVTNVIDHAYDDNAAHSICLTLHVAGDQIRLEIEDDGKPFDPAAKPTRPAPSGLEDARIGGWGIDLVRHFARDLRYCRTDARNHLTAIFHHTNSTPH